MKNGGIEMSEEKVYVDEYSAKLDNIHIVVSSDALCGKPMLAHNYLATGKNWTEKDREDLLKFHPRTICPTCMNVLGKQLTLVKQAKALLNGMNEVE